MVTVRWLVTAGIVSVLAVGSLAGTGPSPSPTPEPPPAQPPPQLDRADVDRAVARLDPSVAELMRKTGVPGVSVAVVYEDEVVHIEGYDYYGRLTVVEEGGGLVLRLGPEPQSYRLTHYDGNTFSFPTRGENAVGPTGVTFSPDGRTVRVEYLDEQGLGTFTRQ